MKKQMNMFDWYKKVVLKNYANFNGRARRSEYWYFTLCNILIYIVLFFVLGGIGAASGDIDSSNEAGNLLIGTLFMIFAFAIFIPSIAVAVRRLHDVGRSGWSYLITFVPIAGPIILLVWLATDSQPGINKWGPNPKDLSHTTFDFDNKDLTFNQ